MTAFVRQSAPGWTRRLCRTAGAALFRYGSAALVALLPIALPWTATAAEPPAAVHVQMRNVAYHYTSDVSVSLVRLDGALRPTGEQVPVFDDKRSFTLEIEAAEIRMSLASLANVLNTYVFAARDAPLKDISISVSGGKLKVKGKLHDKGDVGFETEGTLSPTADGQIRLHAEKIRALHLPLKHLMDLFGVKIADLIRTSKVHGLRFDGDDLVLDPQQILPPPHIHGKVTSVGLHGDEIVQIFGHGAGAPAEFAGNYMAYRGNSLRFGKLTMENTDMVLIDMDPRDAFDFYLDHYQQQLTAGYTKITPAFGLRVYMRDYNKLRADRKPAQKVH